MSILDDLPQRLIAAEHGSKLAWEPHGREYLYANLTSGIGLYLTPSRHRWLRKKLDAQLEVFHNGTIVRTYSGETVNELYALVYLQHAPTQSPRQTDREARASAALEHLLG